MASVSTYLNFAGTTEQAFLFYKSIFGGEFLEQGIQRFSDMPATEGQPPLPPETANMVMHVGLPILGGHVLYATDAPESMGFTVVHGNAVHLNLDIDTREETERLFQALSQNGKITASLQDMFWGAYFGSVTDQFGINWMFHCAHK